MKKIEYCGIITLNGEQFDTLHDSGKGMFIFKNSGCVARVSKKCTSNIGSSYSCEDIVYKSEV